MQDSKPRARRPACRGRPSISRGCADRADFPEWRLEDCACARVAGRVRVPSAGGWPSTRRGFEVACRQGVARETTYLALCMRRRAVRVCVSSRRGGRLAWIASALGRLAERDRRGCEPRTGGIVEGRQLGHRAHRCGHQGQSAADAVGCAGADSRAHGRGLRRRGSADLGLYPRRRERSDRRAHRRCANLRPCRRHPRISISRISCRTTSRASRSCEALNRPCMAVRP